MPSLETTTTPPPQPPVEEPKPDKDSVKSIENLSNQEEEEENNNHSDGSSDSSDGEKDEYIMVKLTGIRKDVQCPICLGIISKTRTVTGCLHRFCGECIDKSMQLGNNECPACRKHCASRCSVIDDPNFDALIAVLFPESRH